MDATDLQAVDLSLSPPPAPLASDARFRRNQAPAARQPIVLDWADRLLLAAGITAARQRVPDPLNVGAEEVPTDVVATLLPRLLRERLLPAVHAYGVEQGFSWAHELEQHAHLVGAGNALAMQHLEPVLRSLNERAIPVMLLKGLDLMLTVYPRGLPRMMDDIDLLVRPPDVPAVIDLLSERGFLQGTADVRNLRVIPGPATDISAVLAHHYELPPFLKFVPAPDLRSHATFAEDASEDYHFSTLAGEVYWLLELDIHFNVAAGVDVRDSWHDLRRYRTPAGAEILAQSPADRLWLLCARGYDRIAAEEPAALRSFIDILCVLARDHERIVWARLTTLAERYGTQPSVYYMLWHAAEILDEPIPDWVLETLNPGAAHVDRTGDVGDFVPRLFGAVDVHPLL